MSRLKSKQFSIRNTLGVITIIAIVLALSRRILVEYVINDDLFLHALCVPYYADFWILNLESLWPFQENFDDRVMNHHNIKEFAAIIVSTISGLIWFVIHGIILITIFSYVSDFFFKETK